MNQGTLEAITRKHRIALCVLSLFLVLIHHFASVNAHIFSSLSMFFFFLLNKERQLADDMFPIINIIFFFVLLLWLLLLFLLQLLGAVVRGVVLIKGSVKSNVIYKPWVKVVIK